MALGERRHRDHVALRVAHVQVHDVFGLHAVDLVRLHDHTLLTTIVREVVGVCRAQRRRQHGVDVGERDTQRIGLLAVDIHLVLRRIFQAFWAHAGDDLALRRHPQQLIASCHQRVVAEARAVLQTERKARCVTQFRNRRRIQRKDDRIANATEQRTKGPADHGIGGLILALALAPVLERGEHDTRVRPVAREAETLDSHDVLDRLFLLVVVLDLLDHFQRAVGRCTRRQLDVGHDVALDFGRHERRRQAQEQEHHRHDQRNVDDHVAEGFLEHALHEALIAVRGGAEHAVEPAEEALLLVVRTLLDRLEQRRAQCRRERQRHECREEDR